MNAAVPGSSAAEGPTSKAHCSGVKRRASEGVMRKGLSLLVKGVAPALLLSGCVMGRVYRDHPLDEVKIATIRRGVTAKQEILDLFGPPQEIEVRELTAIGIPFEQFLSRRGDKPPIERIVAARFYRYTYTRANALAIILILFN
jgi:hypothetical protein